MSVLMSRRSYPTKLLFKASKLIPIMMVGRLIFGKVRRPHRAWAVSPDGLLRAGGADSTPRQR